MTQLTRYVKRPDQAVTAIQINLEISGFSYEKWGSIQQCKKGDWLAENKKAFVQRLELYEQLKNEFEQPDSSTHPTTSYVILI